MYSKIIALLIRILCNILDENFSGSLGNVRTCAKTGLKLENQGAEIPDRPQLIISSGLV